MDENRDRLSLSKRTLLLPIFRTEVAFRCNCFKEFSTYLYDQKILCPTDSAHLRISILLRIDEFDSNVTYTDSHVMEPHGRCNVE